MKNLLLTLVLMTTCSQMAFSRCQRRMPRPNPIMGALQNLFLPGSERAMKGMLPVAQIPREAEMPNVRVIQPKCACQEIIYSNGPEMCPQVLSNIPLVPNMPMPIAAPILPMSPMPMPAIPAPPLPMPVPALQPEIIYPLPSVLEKCPCSSCMSPAPLVSPFLPAASPVSAWAPPTSNMLPPVIPNQSRSHFLRKVPIPPPSL